MRLRLTSRRTCVPIALLVALLVFDSITVRTQLAWTITDLGTLGGLFGDANDINDNGHIVGESSAPLGGDRAFLWTPEGGMEDLGTLGGTRAVANAINNAGQVVGVADLEEDGLQRAFLWTAEGGMTNLGVLGETFPGFASSSARDINEMGHVVGASSVPGGQHAFLWTPLGGMEDPGTLGGQNSVARAINDAGHIVGQSDTATGEEHGFLWTPELGMQDLGTLGGTSSSAADINSLGQVVGRAALANGDEHAFLWTAEGGMQDLGTLGGEGSRSQAEGINDAGEVVGLFTGNDDRAFYWTAAGGMIELPSLTPGGEAAGRAINSSGQIAGYGDIATGDAHAVVWNRTDNPPTPQAQIVALQSSLEGLVTGGVLTTGQANGLSRPLQNASRSLEQGKTASACSQLADFVVEVTRKVSDGVLSSAGGSALIEAATGVRAALGCS